MFSSKEILLEL